MTRKEAREQAFILIFEHEFRKSETFEEIVDTAEAYFNEKVNEFSYILAKNAIENAETIDGYIEKYSLNWKKVRISKVNLAVLRLAIGEMLYYDDTPDSVAINEAVEIVKKYGGDEEKAYVNGVLGKFVKEKDGARDVDAKDADAAEEIK
ncbi:MAG: transcription antitermination factor NusB [Oscillospiraceae bacterium]|nr:transcription antitermination factor NusB [Oscillospiraceae bacterium]